MSTATRQTTATASASITSPLPTCPAELTADEVREVEEAIAVHVADCTAIVGPVRAADPIWLAKRVAWATREAIDRIKSRRLYASLDDAESDPTDWPAWTDSHVWNLGTAPAAYEVHDPDDWHTTEPTPLHVLEASAPFDPDAPAVILSETPGRPRACPYCPHSGR